MLFGVLALGAGLLMTRLLRDPRGARSTDPRLLAAGAARRRRGAHAERGDLARADLGVARLAARGDAARGTRSA